MRTWAGKDNIRNAMRTARSAVFQMAEKLSGMANTGQYKRIAGMLRTAFFIVVYVFFVYNYANFEICVKKESFVYLNIIFGVILFIFNLDIKVLHNDKVKKYFSRLLLFVIPLMSVWVIEVMCNPVVGGMKHIFFFLNYLLLFFLEIFLVALLGERTGLYIVTLSAFLFAIINYFVLKFKGMPFTPADVFAINTAADVAQQYQFFISDFVIYSSLIYMMEICLIKHVDNEIWKKEEKTRLVKKYGVLLGCVLLGVILYNVDFPKALDFEFSAWRLKESYYEYGSSFSFFMELQQLRPQKVSGYSERKVDDILNRYGDVQSKVSDVRPNVVIVMNESFCDLSVLGNIDTDNCLYNWKNADYVMRGNAYASQYGGGTCNTEFEMLTGLTMSFIPNGTYPYQNYSLKKTKNLVKVLKDNDYSCIAIHPAKAENWNRTVVYNDMGFDEFLDINEFISPEYYHMYISDKSVYEKIKEELASKEGPTAVFAITMQNHGGYALDSLEGAEALNIGEFSQYDQAVTYMTTLKESDKAFQGFVDYMMSIDEPTIFCMFGDHQPNLGDDFNNYLVSTDMEGKSELERDISRYIVPYIIISNYDMGMERIERDLSLNYLGAALLGLSGCTTPYFEFINDMQQKVPVINQSRYMTGDLQWHDMSEENPFLKEYEMIQYYNLFEKK